MEKKILETRDELKRRGYVLIRKIDTIGAKLIFIDSDIPIKKVETPQVKTGLEIFAKEEARNTVHVTGGLSTAFKTIEISGTADNVVLRMPLSENRVRF